MRHACSAQTKGETAMREDWSAMRHTQLGRFYGTTTCCPHSKVELVPSSPTGSASATSAANKPGTPFVSIDGNRVDVGT